MTASYRYEYLTTVVSLLCLVLALSERRASARPLHSSVA